MLWRGNAAEGAQGLPRARIGRTLVHLAGIFRHFCHRLRAGSLETELPNHLLDQPLGALRCLLREHRPMGVHRHQGGVHQQHHQGDGQALELAQALPARGTQGRKGGGPCLTGAAHRTRWWVPGRTWVPPSGPCASWSRRPAARSPDRTASYRIQGGWAMWQPTSSASHTMTSTAAATSASWRWRG